MFIGSSKYTQKCLSILENDQFPKINYEQSKHTLTLTHTNKHIQTHTQLLVLLYKGRIEKHTLKKNINREINVKLYEKLS